MTKIVSAMSWSGGKDSAMALYEALKSGKYDIRYLMTSVSAKDQRISMHGVPFHLLEKQAASIGIPIFKIEIPESCDMSEYDRIMQERTSILKQEGIELILFGDIFLEHLKKYRTEQLKKVKLSAHFPIWGRETAELSAFFLKKGFEAITACVNSDKLDKSFAARKMDRDFFNSLPGDVDQCGENGEYHSFVYNGPIFKNPVNYTVKKIIDFKYPAPENDDGIHEQKETRVYFTDFE